MKLTRHNGRTGKNGVYNPKHNDRQFNIDNSDHIDLERAKRNVYWDCYNGIRSASVTGKEDYCFGCGVTGDVIDFTAQLLGLSLKEAALKLADDFGIQISRVDRRKIKKPRKILKSKPEKNLVKSEEQEYIECVRAMLDYRILLQKWKKEFAPKSPEEEWDEKFVEALKYLTIVEYYLDLLLFGEEEEKVQVVEMIKKEVEKIDRRCRKNG